MIYLFALVAIAVADIGTSPPATQTIGYYATIGECQVERNKVEKNINKSLTKLDCIPIKHE